MMTGKQEDIMTIYDVVKKLVGPIRPVGDTIIDDERFKNLKVMTALVDKLLTDIDAVGTEATAPEYSRKRAGRFANDFLIYIGIDGKLIKETE